MGPNGGGRATVALLAFSVLIWGTSWWPIDVASDHTSPIMLATLRIGPTLILVALIFAAFRRKLPEGRVLMASAVSGVLMFGFFQYVLMETVATLGPGNSAVVINTSPLFVGLLGFLFLHERLGVIGSAGLVIGFLGVVLMVWSQVGDFPSTGTLVGGVLLAFVGALAWGIAALVLRSATRGRDDIDMIGVTVVQYGAGAIVLVPVGFAVAGTSGTDWSAAGLWIPLLWIGPITALALLFFFIVLQRMQAARATSVLFLIPAVAIVIEIVRGNAPGTVTLGGMFVAILGVALVTAPRELFTWAALRAGLSRARAWRAPGPA
jgi:drug/metabolite transporter (DMT)-like permease